VLPYQGPYVAKELVVAQIVNYGFKLIGMHQYIPQRYILEFQRDDSATVQAPTEALAPYQVAEKIKKGEIKDAVRPVDFARKVELAKPNKPVPADKKAADKKATEKKATDVKATPAATPNKPAAQ
jgi:hypothetical protein